MSDQQDQINCGHRTMSVNLGNTENSPIKKTK